MINKFNLITFLFLVTLPLCSALNDEVIIPCGSSIDGSVILGCLSEDELFWIGAIQEQVIVEGGVKHELELIKERDNFLLMLLVIVSACFILFLCLYLNNKRKV